MMVRPALPYLALGALLLAAPVASAGAQDSASTRIPSPEELSPRLCGRSLAPTDGLILGVLRTAEGTTRPGLQVAALWNEAEITRSGSRTLLRASVDTSAADGSFVLCGVPRETALRLRAGTDAEGTGELSMTVPETGLVRRELIVGPVTLDATVTGKVVDAEGRAIAAWITLEGDTTTAARSDSTGAFNLRRVPRRSGQLSIRAVGLVPLTIDVAPDGPLVELGDVLLSAVVQQMAELTVRERMLAQREQEFEYRRRVLRGYFFDETELRRYPRVHAGVLAGRSPSLRAAPGGLLSINRAFRQCYPRYWFDGVPYGNRPPAEVFDDFLRRAKRVEVYFAAFAPPEFVDFDGCGAVVVWTD